MPVGEFGALLDGLVRRYGTRNALGKLIGMSGSRVGRAVDGQYAFNVENCLKLAEATGESPSVILRAAGKGEIADLIERLYGSSRPIMSPSERDHLDRWNALDAEARRELGVIIRKLAPKARQPAKRKTA